MNCDKLNEDLTAILDDFSRTIQSQYGDADVPVKECDITELARQTFYALNGFRTEIVKYLSNL